MKILNNIFNKHALTKAATLLKAFTFYTIKLKQKCEENEQMLSIHKVKVMNIFNIVIIYQSNITKLSIPHPFYGS